MQQKRKIVHLIASLFILTSLIWLGSCSDDSENEADTFNLDTLIINPSTAVESGFEIVWGVSTTGFPQFLVQIYLSDDDILDANDLLLADVADTDTNSDASKSYFNTLFFQVEKISGTPITKFNYKFESDNTWLGDATTDEDLSGKTKYIIGRFYHTQGLIIDVKRSRLAVEVDFK